MHHGRTTGNAYGVAAKVMKIPNAPNTPNRTTKIISPPDIAKANTQTAQAAIGNSSANNPSILSKQNTSVPPRNPERHGRFD